MSTVEVTVRHSLTVSEIFGPTLQGEGPSAGRPAAFLRLGLCNLDCSWCDTPYTWDWTGKNGPPQDRGALERLDVEQVVARLRAMHVPLVVITGGEPLIQRKHLSTAVMALRLYGLTVEIETNGTIHPGAALDQWDPLYNVSPKLAHSGVPREVAWDLDVLRWFAATGRAVLKPVVRGPADLAEVDELVKATGFAPGAVWVMPEGRTPEAIRSTIRGVADLVVDRRYNLTTRLHVLAWGDERGR